MITPPLSLYVHLPWCLRKCPYCDFNSYEAGGSLPEEEYVAALLRDLDVEADHARGRMVRSIFVGGGTPSLFSGHAIATLMDGIRARVGIAADAEVTLEANPGAAEARRFEEYRRAGVNRLSMGVQSFRDPQLRALGRIHSAEEAALAYAAARSAGFEDVNLDLMYALPGDGVAEALADLREAIALRPGHLSWYQLTLEPDTAFHRRPPRGLPEEEAVCAIEEAGRALLAQSGYARYEVSAYATPGRQCRHNLNYWQFGDYLGIGAGAHAKLTVPREGRIERRARQRNPRSYMRQAGTPEAYSVECVADTKQRIVEYMMNALRLCEGFECQAFETCTGVPWSRIEAAVSTAVAGGLLECERRCVRPTAAGMRYLNNLVAAFDTTG
ncbi:MAG: radical SAM family heme chaperone HemW [Gammaproteobacteria bacterium]|nr:radical SAM family heme chaperone HemW [Gammaproteobacteria bacterium]MCG3146540.1 Oxygen-independent coproporphyrinogen-III oxidase-like protein [Gammaproteobacteria bacterium]